MSRSLNLEIRINADGRAALVALDQAGKKVGELDARMRQAGPAGRAAGREAADGISQIRREAQQTDGVVAGLRTQIAGFAAAVLSVQGARALASMADQYRNISTQIGLITRGEAELANVRSRTFEIAQRTFASFDATTTLVARLSRATSELTDDSQLAQATALGLAETIQQTFAISGAGQQEASNAIRQLAQGLAAGALRGDEFNSVMEQAPRLAQALANSLGVTTGELRAQAEQGKLTSATIVNALVEQRDTIEREFATVPVTIERASVQARNSLLRVVGEIDERFGISGSIARGIQGIGERIGQLPAATAIWGDELSRIRGVGDGFFAGFLDNLDLIPLNGREAFGRLVDEILILPTSLRTAITIMLAEGEVLLIRFGVLTQGLGALFERAWILARETGSTAFGLIQIRFAEMIDELLAGLASFAERSANVLAAVPGMAERAEALRQIGAGLAEAATFEELYRAELKANQEAYDAERAAIDRRLAQGREQAQQRIDARRDIAAAALAEREEALERLRGARAAEAQGDALRKLGEDGRTGAGGLKQTAEAAKESRDALTRLADLTAQWSGELSGGLSRALAQHSARLRQLQQIEAALARTQSLSAQSQAQLAQARELAAQSLRRAIEDQVAALGGPLAQAELEQRRRLEEIEVVRAQLIEQGEDAAAVERLVADAVARANREHAENARRLREREQPYSTLLRQLREEIDLLSLSTRARQDEALAIELRNRALAEGINLSEAEARAQARSIEAARRRAALEGRARDLTERGEAVFGLRIDAQLDEVFPFRTFGDLLAGATASGLERGIPGFLGTLSQGLRQAFDENPLQAAAGIADFAAQVIAQRRAGRDTAGSFLFAANQSAAQSGIPEAQAVAAVVSAIDSIFGGRLLGTAWERSGTGLRLGLGAGGVTGSTSETQVRQRSLFRGRQWRTTDSPLDDAARGQLEDFLDQLREALRNGARALRTEVPPLIEGSFAEVRDATGRVISQTSTILGRTYSESVEAFQRRLTAENLIALVDRALGGTVRAAAEQAGQQAAQGIADGLDRGIEDGGITLPKSISAIQGEASAIAERWRADAERLLDGAQLLLRAATDLRGGFNLLGDGSLTQVVDLVEELAQAGEPLADAYVRVVGATRLLDEALALSGLTLDRTREDLVRFASEIADAAGGIDRATSLWATYFETFFSAEERAALSLRRAQERASTQLGDIGLDAAGFSGSDGLARFRALFEDVFATLSAEAVVEWLEAAEALAQLVAAAEGADGSLTNAAQALAELLAGVEAEIERLAPPSFAERIARIEQGLAETLARATELGATEEQLARIRLSGALQLQAVLDEQDAALRRYTDTVQGIRDTIADLSGLSEFGRQVREIERWARDTAAALNAQARAAGLASARTEDLALVQEAAALRMAAAIRALTQRGQSLVERLYGTALDQLNTQIGTLEGAIGSVGSAIGGVQEASDQLFRQQQQQVQRIRDFLDQSLLTPQGGLRPRDQLQEALRQFGGLFTRAQGGDVDALGNITGLSDTIFRLIRDVFGSSAQGDAIRAQIRAQLEQLAGLQFPGGGGTPGGTGAPVPPAELQELYRERERLLAQQAAAERRELATELLGIVADLVRATGEPLAAIAATLGFEMRALVEDLGVNLGELSDATAVRLADIAQSLGVNLSELSQSVGVDLGSLADSQSLLNNALEARIRALPTEQRDQLEPLLRGVEEAAALGDNALLEQRMAALIAATNSLPPLLRNSLAPFFDQVDPVFYDQLSALSAVDTNTYSIAETARSQLDVLIEIRDRLEEPQPVEPPPEELILGKAGLYAAQIEAAAAAATGDSVAAELRALLAAQREIAEALRSVSERIEALELATVNAAGEQADAVDRLVDTLRTR